MSLAWQIKAGHLNCRWYEMGQQITYKPRWYQEAPDMQGSYSPPLPDFASHSPFGRASWFELHKTAERNFE
jgi:hypothetical protein